MKELDNRSVILNVVVFLYVLYILPSKIAILCRFYVYIAGPIPRLCNQTTQSNHRTDNSRLRVGYETKDFAAQEEALLVACSYSLLIMRGTISQEIFPSIKTDPYLDTYVTHKYTIIA